MAIARMFQAEINSFKNNHHIICYNSYRPGNLDIIEKRAIENSNRINPLDRRLGWLASFFLVLYL